MTDGVNLFSSLRIRFACLFSVTALILGMIYFGAMIWVQKSTEEQLLSSSMKSMLEEEIENLIENGKEPWLDSLSRLYIEGDKSRPIPKEFQELPEGYSKHPDMGDFHVYVKTVGGRRYVMTRHQKAFAEWERAQFVKGIILLAVVVFVTFSVGMYMINRMLGPMEQLRVKALELERQMRAGIIDDKGFEGVWGTDEIRELAVAFENMTGRFKESWERERRFASEVSHELRTPMTVIGMSIEMLKDGENLTNRQKEYVIRANRTFLRMKELLEVFIDISRGYADKTSRTATIPEIIGELAGDWDREAKEKGLEFVLNVGDFNHPHVSPPRFNAVLAGAVLNNLVNNAIRYTDKGSVSILAEGGRISVKDTGLGISEADRGRIFEAGFRGAINENSEKVGFGLGLAIALRSCTVLGWKISVASEEGVGSTFVIDADSKRV